MNKTKILSLFLLPIIILFANLPVNADNGLIPVRVKIDSRQITEGKSKSGKIINSNTNQSEGNYKNIQLIKLSEEQIEKIKNRFDKAGSNKDSQKEITLEYPIYPEKLSGAIFKMPVLDQANEGACVTFANTAALDITFKHGSNEISIYRSMDIGDLLHEGFKINNLGPEDKAFCQRMIEAIGWDEYPNPWEGSFSNIVTEQMKTYGIWEIPDSINEDFILEDGTFSKEMNPYTNSDVCVKNEDITDNFNTKTLQANENEDITKTSLNVKNALDKGHVVAVDLALHTDEEKTFGQLVEFKLDKNNTEQKLDLSKTNAARPNVWSCLETTERNSIERVGGHALVTIGYMEHKDDPNRAVFILRNSWGREAGDAGDYYVTDTYLNIFCDRALQISDKSSTNRIMI